MTMGTAESYDALAPQYHLIFENWEASIERQAAILGSILKVRCGLPGDARILDCACGIGTQALGLAKLRFRVSGCDLSARAVERARQEASARSLDIPFAVADMLDLSTLGDSRLDAVICMDNSLPHLENPEQLRLALAQIRKRLQPGGFFMASIRDYDRLVQEKPLVQGPFFYSDDGRRRIVFQVWDWVDDRRYIFHLYITREVDQGWQTLHTSAPYRALLRDEVATTLSQEGFENVRWLNEAESGFYQPIVLADAG
jgi:glycine/sarcosine N-methyltransferase